MKCSCVTTSCSVSASPSILASANVRNTSAGISSRLRRARSSAKKRFCKGCCPAPTSGEHGRFMMVPSIDHSMNRAGASSGSPMMSVMTRPGICSA